MPELPEVETTVKGLKEITNKQISKVYIHTKKLRFKIPIGIKKRLFNSKISNIRRIAKYIIIDLDNMYSIVIHLGMSGRLKISNINVTKNKHDHFVIIFYNKKSLVFNDQRKFGFIDLVESYNILKQKYIINLGIDALSRQLKPVYLHDKICNSIVPIKQILLNQNVISGIGNIYASEILFDARISPLTKGKELKISHITRLILSIRKILRKAIKFGGSSIKDFKSADGTLGNFQSNFKVYNKEGAYVDEDHVIKIVQYGRSTFYCPNIQNNN